MKRFLTLALALILILSTAAASAQTLQIAAPDDATNLARAIKLLETAGFIEVDPAAGYSPEIKDITNYIYDIEVVPVAANTLTSTLTDYAGAVINGTWATTVGLIPSKDGLIVEQQAEGGENPYVNILVARTEDADNEIYQKIVDAYHTQLVAEFMLLEYNEAYYPAFEYETDPALVINADNVAALKDYYYNVASPAGKTVVKVGVCGTKNDMFAAVQWLLDQENAGIYIELVVLDNYNLPNDALNNRVAKDLDLNAFEHKAYLAKEMASFGYDLTIIADTLIAPLTLYSNNYASIDAIKDAAGLMK
ncbi:MAG: MetQ/NlpA family ABC transporter substrate-binding protein [Clostridia bacterium]|nr:MetQ/NlpA family ABC transporter substrate-binding protein [Clostridia bacterium]